MQRAFERLRIATLAVGTLGTVGGGLARAALAASTQLLPHIFVPAGLSLKLTNNTFGATNTGFPSKGFGISTAKFPGGRSDAFDGALCLDVDHNHYKDPDGHVDIVGGNRLVGSPTTLSKLRTTVEYDFPVTMPVIRALFTFRNPTSKTIHAAARVSTNLGSDSTTLVETSSDSDSTAESTDSYFVTDDGATNHDPFLIFGQGDRPVATLVSPAGTGILNDVYHMAVPAGGTQRILLYFWVNSTRGEALTNASNFANGARLAHIGLLDGVSRRVAAQVINWKRLARFR